MKTYNKLLSLILAVVLLFGCMTTLIACRGKAGAKIDNESTRLVLSTAELDGVFNPFYSSSGPDGSVVGMTQIGMLSSDKFGQVAYGKDEACVVLDYTTETYVDGNGEQKTKYLFVLKNDLKFSNGSPLTMKDVLFNLYVYLDPAYYGSATIYSTDIVGLAEYRTQTDNESEQEGFNEKFDALADDRINRFVECVTEIYEDNTYFNGGKTLTDDQFITKLTEKMQEKMSYGGDIAEKYGTVVEDYELIKKYYNELLDSVWNMSVGTAGDVKFLDESGKEIKLTTDTEAFLYNMGLIRWDEKEYEFIYTLGNDSKDLTKEQVKNAIFTSTFPMDAISGLSSVYVEIFTRFALLEKQAYFEGITQGRINNISGIRFANKDAAVSVKGTNYDKPTYNSDGSVASGNEVLEITINEVDPKAIWNFAFTVAPMYYYSTYEVYKDFDYETNFGVKFGSIDFQDEVVKNPDKIGVPVGAGAYKATTRTGDSSAVTAGTFRDKNVVYFERNDHFMFDVKIKYVNYQVVSTNLMLDALYSGDVHFVEPSCTQDNIDSVADRAGDGFASVPVQTNGYGYIGINAADVPNIYVRQAIMHAINTQYAVDYYAGYSEPIYRPMTRASWAYPKDTDALGQFYAFDESGATSEYLVSEMAGYSKNGKGKFVDENGNVLKYTFTIAGDTADHPAYQSLKRAADILNSVGFDIEVKTDINALKKLNNGDLTVWAAAWGAGVDPDMYQVYHIDSATGSTKNWGYPAIKANAGGKYDYELSLVKDLSDIIDYARETLDTDERKYWYAQALDIVMELAVELPTYQRSDLFAYNTNIIDVSTMTPAADLTPYNGPISKLWELSLNERN